MSAIKGSCRCGKVTYSSDADPVFVGVCHCKSCQKSTGGVVADGGGGADRGADGERSVDPVR